MHCFLFHPMTATALCNPPSGWLATKRPGVFTCHLRVPLCVCFEYFPVHAVMCAGTGADTLPPYMTVMPVLKSFLLFCNPRQSAIAMAGLLEQHGLQDVRPRHRSTGRGPGYCAVSKGCEKLNRLRRQQGGRHCQHCMPGTREGCASVLPFIFPERMAEVPALPGTSEISESTQQVYLQQPRCALGTDAACFWVSTSCHLSLPAYTSLIISHAHVVLSSRCEFSFFHFGKKCLRASPFGTYHKNRRSPKQTFHPKIRGESSSYHTDVS